MLQTQIIYCSDNLSKLRELPTESVDLIYIDPPFNSNRDYETFWGDTKEKRAFEDRFGAVQHYIDWMRPRIIEIQRILKTTGSFYYHCDWHADAYVRVMLDEIFGFNNFNTHIVWRRTNAKGLAFRSFPNNHDSVFFYTKSKEYTFNRQFLPHNEKYLADFYKYVEEETGRRYRLGDLTNPNKDRPNLTYEFLGVTRVWRWTKERMQEAYEKGLVIQTKPNSVPVLKRYLDEQEGTPVDSIWTDILPVQAKSEESLGYPTQKPLALLNRIIQASSNEGDVILDAFCGCGTALHAAQNLGRKWIGIDVSPTACRVMSQRLEKYCYIKEGKDFFLFDTPKTVEELLTYPPFEFENWAVNALNSILTTNQSELINTQGKDVPLDGRVYSVTAGKEKQNGRDLFGETDYWMPIQVKQKDEVNHSDVISFESAMKRQRRERGFFVAFGFTPEAKEEIERLSKNENIEIISITVHELLRDERGAS